MTGKTQLCDEQRLRTLLDSRTADGEADAAAHLESCPRCQSRLSELAADADSWTEVRRLLAADPADVQLIEEARERPWSDGTQGNKATAWTETMARHLLAPPSHPEMLGRLGRYEVERLIGSGGMGIVFKGFDTELNRPVAIKVLAPHLAGSGAARQRFAREARAAAAVVHEHVVAIHNVESDGPSRQPEASARDPSSRLDAPARAPFLVMQYVAGESLQTRLDRQGPLALREILRIAHQTAAGLAAAHAQGLVHRDVKPSNILLEQGIERALLTDFGLARAADDASLTHTGYMPGTPNYMSPEQVRGDAVDARSDLFSLGSVIYAMCTGRPPFRADTSFGVLRRITDTDPRPIRDINPDIPAWLALLIDKLLSKDPAHRFSSAAELATLLEQCLAHVQQPSAVPLPAACRVGSAHHRRWLPISMALTLLLIAVSAAIVVATRPHLNPWMPRGPFPNKGPAMAASDESPSDLNWDKTGDEINAVSADVDSIERKIDQLWDRQPFPAPRNTNSETVP